MLVSHWFVWAMGLQFGFTAFWDGLCDPEGFVGISLGSRQGF